MQRQPDIKKRVEQFYKLLSANGLGGKKQPMNQQKRRDIDKLFPD